MTQTKSDHEIFIEGTEIDKALQRGVREALIKHKKLGFPIVVAKDGKITWIQPEDIEIPEEDAD